MAGVGGSIMGILSSIIDIAAQGAENAEQDRYNTMMEAYNREADRIAKENEERRARVQRRREISRAIGSNQGWLEPIYKEIPRKPESYTGSEAAQALSTFSDIVNMVGGAYDMAGGISGGTSGGTTAAPADHSINYPTATVQEPVVSNSGGYVPAQSSTYQRYRIPSYTGTSIV